MLPRPSDFEFHNLAGASAKPFLEALDSLQTGFTKCLHEGYEDAARLQTELVDQMQRLDKTIAATVAKQSKALHTDYTPLTKVTQGLEAQVARVRESITVLVDDLSEIEDWLPPADRLMAPDLPHRKHYPQLHNLLTEKRLQQPLCLEPGRPDAQVTHEAASAESATTHSDHDLRATLRSFTDSRASSRSSE